jgi:hypothetical protein
MSFNTLPTELRHAILDFALPDDEPEVCLIWSMDKRYSEPTDDRFVRDMPGPLLVDTAFPVLMHVCRS